MQTGPILTESGRQKSMRDSTDLKTLEKKASSLPATFFLSLAGAAIALSFGLAISSRKKNWANFVGQWVPTILLLGIYDKVTNLNRGSKDETRTRLH